MGRKLACRIGGTLLGREPRPLRMGLVDSPPALMAPAGDVAVMGEAGGGHPCHECAGAFGELDGFGEMVGIVLSDLTVNVVDGEGGDPAESAWVGRVFVGEERLPCNCFPGKALGEAISVRGHILLRWAAPKASV